MKTETLCVQNEFGDDPHHAMSPPIYQTATFRQESATEFGEYDYTRSGNPTRALVEEQLARLEGGTRAFAFSSGMAAVNAVTRLLRAGDELLAADDLYGGTFRLLGRVLPRLGIGARLVDATKPERVAASFGEKTRVLFVETPSNPRLQLCDIARLADLAHAHGALLAVDNSLLSPVLQKPLLQGADLVIHSATKALGGHSDLTAGVVVVKDAALAEQIAFFQNAEGNGLAPFEAWLLNRGIKTLALRVERQAQSAERIAGWLRARVPWVAQAGPVVSFATGDADWSQRIVEATRLFAIAVSFGSVHSTISLPLHMSHASTPQHLRKGDVGPDLVRLSVGIEAVDDLIADLDAAFTKTAVRGVQVACGS